MKEPCKHGPRVSCGNCGGGSDPSVNGECAVCGERIILDQLDRVWEHEEQPEFHAAIPTAPPCPEPEICSDARPCSPGCEAKR